MITPKFVLTFFLTSCLHSFSAFAPSSLLTSFFKHHQLESGTQPSWSQISATQDDTNPTTSTAPVLNGKRVLPFKVLMAGLKGNKVAGTYAILSSEYKRGSEGWEFCQHVGVSMDLETTLNEHLKNNSPEKVAHVRALTFVIPSQGAMEEIATQWKTLASEAGGHANLDPVLAALEDAIPFDDEDEDDEWDEEDDEVFAEMEMAAAAMSRARDQPATPTDVPSESSDSKDVVSPFDESNKSTKVKSEDAPLKFTRESVDKVLEEVRPYLIADGGNVSVQSVDEATGNVYLKLEGACGSCASSTVTMKMGIERVLKENFADLGEVIQIEDGEEDKPKELTYQAVENEVNRIKPAIIAMGGVVNIISVDPIGVVELEFRGANKVRQGLELAILDIDFVKHVKFVSQSD